MTTLTNTDLKRFTSLGISPTLLGQAQIKRVSALEANSLYGFTSSYGSDLAGVIIPNLSPITGLARTYTLRLDNPPVENGKPKNKYLHSAIDRSFLYFPPSCKDSLDKSTVPVIVVESEKACLAMTEAGKRLGRDWLVIGTSGVWGWKGKIGKLETPDGRGTDERGPLPDLDLVSWEGREAIILFDANTATNPKVRAARWKLAEELVGRGALVKLGNLPVLKSVNGPDDLLQVTGVDQIVAEVLDTAVSFAESARKEALAAIDQIEAQITPLLPEEIKELTRVLATIEDGDTRELLTSRAAQILRGTITKGDLQKRVGASRSDLLKARTETKEHARLAALMNKAVNRVGLARDLEKFFAERLHLPVGAALILAFFTENTWTFELFDTTPYLCLESATPECGKTTVERLLNALCCRPQLASSITEAVLFRLVDARRPTLLLDEAESLEGRSERAEALRSICNEGYKKGGQVARCEGEEREIRWFDVFSPKVFAVIGGVTGTLLSRSIVIHMERAPRNSVRKSTRLRSLERDAKLLRETLESYSLQIRAALIERYEAEPDEGYWPQITDREAEIWGPLLMHARLASPELEVELLHVIEVFSRGKREIEAGDWGIAMTIAALAAIRALEEKTEFVPADLLDSLNDSEAWAATFGKVKNDNRNGKSARVGYFLKKFRLKKTHTVHGSSFSREEALRVLSAHLPETESLPEPTTRSNVNAANGPATVPEPGESGFIYQPRPLAAWEVRMNGAEETE